MFNERYGIQDDPLGYALRLVLNNTYNTKKYLDNFINNSTIDDCQQERERLKLKISQSESSRRIVYCSIINKNLSIHGIYTSKHNIYELYRKAFTRFRVSSHMLAVETGRWNRRGRGRLPIEERLCSCGLVQSEEHVIGYCPVSQILREKYEFTSIDNLFSGNFTNEDVCKIIYEVLELYI